MNATPTVASCALIEVSIKAPGQQVVRATWKCSLFAFTEVNEPVARSATATNVYESFY
jgi:hypothetical protein